MNHLKRTLIIGAGVATLVTSGIAGISTVSAATASSTMSSSSASDSKTDGESSLIDKLAAKFKLNKSDVQKVFDEDRSARKADMEAKQADRLSQAVKDGKLTQAQADHITAAQKEIKDLMGDTRPDQLDEATKASIKTKMDALKQWATDNNVDGQYVGHGGMGGHRGGIRPKQTQTDSTSSSTLNQ